MIPITPVHYVVLSAALFIIGIIVDRIQRAFDSLDTRKLTVLRE